MIFRNQFGLPGSDSVGRAGKQPVALRTYRGVGRAQVSGIPWIVQGSDMAFLDTSYKMWRAPGPIPLGMENSVLRNHGAERGIWPDTTEFWTFQRNLSFFDGICRIDRFRPVVSCLMLYLRVAGSNPLLKFVFFWDQLRDPPFLEVAYLANFFAISKFSG